MLATRLTLSVLVETRDAVKKNVLFAYGAAKTARHSADLACTGITLLPGGSDWPMVPVNIRD